MPDKPVVAQRAPCIVEVGSGTLYLVSMRSIESAAVLRWIPYGHGVLADGGSL